MTRVKMVSQRLHCYEGVWLTNGMPFETANEFDAEELVAIGFATRAPDAPARCVTRDLTPETGASNAIAPGAGEVRKPFTYIRRDIVAAK